MASHCSEELPGLEVVSPTEHEAETSFDSEPVPLAESSLSPTPSSAMDMDMECTPAAVVEMTEEDDKADDIDGGVGPEDVEVVAPDAPDGRAAAVPVPVEGSSSGDTGKQKARRAAAARKRKLEEESERLRFVVSHFTTTQLEQYEMCRLAAFPHVPIRKIIHSITGTTVPQNVVIAMAGLAKVFVGEIVEEALEVQERWNELNETYETGPIEPKHIREAVRILRSKGSLMCPLNKGVHRNPFPL